MMVGRELNLKYGICESSSSITGYFYHLDMLIRIDSGERLTDSNIALQVKIGFYNGFTTFSGSQQECSSASWN